MSIKESFFQESVKMPLLKRDDINYNKKNPRRKKEDKTSRV
jgi:hypothetical protein